MMAKFGKYRNLVKHHGELTQVSPIRI